MNTILANCEIQVITQEGFCNIYLLCCKAGSYNWLNTKQGIVGQDWTEMVVKEDHMERPRHEIWYYHMKDIVSVLAVLNVVFIAS